MTRLCSLTMAAALAAGSLVTLTGCSGGGTYAGYTEYRVPPVKTAAEMREEEIRKLRRAKNSPGGPD